MHPSQLSSNVKFLNMLAGVAPPLWGWYETGSWKTALWIFLIGFIAGQCIFGSYFRLQFPNHKRQDDGNFSDEHIEIATTRAMPIFLWSGPICGAAAAIYFIYYV